MVLQHSSSFKLFRKRERGSTLGESDAPHAGQIQDLPPHEAGGNSSGSQSLSGESNELELLARQHALTIMAKHTFEEAQKEKLICDIRDENTGELALQSVALRVSKGNYAYYPPHGEEQVPFVSSLCLLNVGAAITLVSTLTAGVVALIPQDAQGIAINSSFHLQVLKEAGDIAHARKPQGAAFILAQKCVVVWSDEPDQLLIDARYIHHLLTQFLWVVAGSNSLTRGENSSAMLTPRFKYASNSPGASIGPSISSSSGSSLFNGGESPAMPSSESRGQLVLNNSMDEKEYDVEVGMENGYEERPTIILAPLTHGLAFALSLVVSCIQLRSALIWSLLDGYWLRMLVVLAVPFLFCVCMFFCDNIFGSILMFIGPVSQLHLNSRYYSGNKPKPLRNGGQLPHITIQMPVYKEDFEKVLKPSFESIKKSIQTYELQGGSASIIVSEDGMVLIDEQERKARLDYYEENNITWVARPKHGKDGFIREGRFKKASNLNFTYNALLKAEELVKERMEQEPQLTNDRQLFRDYLQQVLADIHPDAQGSGIDKFGEYILLVDSDTRLPADCFLDAATEMTRSKDVGILQHCSGVMLVSDSFFERCIAYFTRLINFSISYAVANGDMAPFMGHNAYLRWSAMKEVVRTVQLDNGQTQLKIWSEDHVSEDFVMAMDMVERGYTVRWATYSNSEYLEGVSLSCDDELNRWQKYSWGVSEMVFRPLKDWWKGPITPLFRRFIWGNTPIHSKWASCSYCFSYYCIALGFPLTIGLTLVQGWLGGDVEAPYLPPFKVFVAVMIVFSGVGAIAFNVVRFRAGYGGFFSLLFGHIKYMPFLIVFFGGISYHVSTALLSHLLSINMTWGATLKDIELTNFFAEVPHILKRHSRQLVLSFLVIAGTAVLATELVPLEYRIQNPTILFPCFLMYVVHILFPFVLNPNMVRFSF